MLRNAFIDDIIIQGAQLLTDTGLYFASQAHFALPMRRLSHIVPSLRSFRIRPR